MINVGRQKQRSIHIVRLVIASNRFMWISLLQSASGLFMQAAATLCGSSAQCNDDVVLMVAVVALWRVDWQMFFQWPTFQVVFCCTRMYRGAQQW